MKYCAQCGTELQDSAHFCSFCGTESTVKRTAVCSKCGSEREKDNKFCPNCGTPYAPGLHLMPPDQIGSTDSAVRTPTSASSEVEAEADQQAPDELRRLDKVVFLIMSICAAIGLFALCFLPLVDIEEYSLSFIDFFDSSDDDYIWVGFFLSVNILLYLIMLIASISKTQVSCVMSWILSAIVLLVFYQPVNAMIEDLGYWSRYVEMGSGMVTAIICLVTYAISSFIVGMDL